MQHYGMHLVEDSPVVPIAYTTFDDEPTYEGFEFLQSTADFAMNEVLVNDLDSDDEFVPSSQDLVNLHEWFEVAA